MSAVVCPSSNLKKISYKEKMKSKDSGDTSSRNVYIF